MTIIRDVIPTLDEILEAYGNGMNDGHFHLPIYMFNVVRPKNKVKNDVEFINVIRDTFTGFVDMYDDFSSKCIHALPSFLSSGVISVRDAGILKVVNDISYLTLFVQDFLYYYLSRGDVSSFPKKRQNDIVNNAPLFMDIFVKYSIVNKKDMIKDLMNLPEELIDENIDDKKSMISTVIQNNLSENNEMLSEFFSDSRKTDSLPTVSSFNGNPIYHIRMWLVDKDLEKYDELKRKRILVQYKLAAIKRKAEGGDASDLNKQIDFNEKKLSDIEYEMAKLRS
jgi:hypothetical protein